jgi:hypothetical protein
MSSNYPDIRQLVSTGNQYRIWPEIRQWQPSSGPGYPKRPGYPAGYRVGRISGACLGSISYR